MASKVKIGGTNDDHVFLGTDGSRRFKVADLDTDDTGATAKDLTGKTIIFDVRRSDSASDTLKAWSCTITGTFNAVAASNTQRAVWTYLDTDLTTDVFGVKGGKFRYSLKDMTDGAETILQYGEIDIERVTQV